MQPDDRKRFATALTALAEYYGKEPSAGVIGLYWQGMSDYPIESVERAMHLHLQNPDNGQFMPKIADLVKLIEGSGTDRAQMAWTKVHGAVKSIGPYQTIVFDDPLIHCVLADMGGFQVLCDMLSTEAPFKAREFEQRYRSYSARREIPPYSSKIVGIAEADCKARGFLEHIPEPVFVGDRQKAQNVLHGGRERSSLTNGEPSRLALVENMRKPAA